MKAKKIVSTLLTLAMVFGLFAAMPLTANAASLTQIKEYIEGLDFGTKGKLYATIVAGKSVVLITGAVTNANKTLEFDISSGLTVKWEADYSGNTNSPDNKFIKLKGNGTFEVAEGKIVHENKGTCIEVLGNNTVNVAGGTVSSYSGANTEAVAISASGTNTINISGGTVKGYGSGGFNHAVRSSGDNTTINVTGGTLIASGSSNSTHTIYSSGANTTINISSGTVRSDYGANAIYTSGNNAKINVTGGMVGSVRSRMYTTGWSTISAGGTGSKITVSGGFVFGRGTAVNSVIYADSFVIKGTAVVCAWDQPTGSTAIVPTYDEGDSTDLVVNSGVTVKWGFNGYDSGIIYSNGTTNSGFFQIDNSFAIVKYKQKELDPNILGSYNDPHIPSTVSVTFDLNYDGGILSVREILQGSKVKAPDNPTRECYSFQGWYTDAACTIKYDFDTRVQENITLYAGWRMEFTQNIPNLAEKPGLDKIPDLDMVVPVNKIPKAQWSEPLPSADVPDASDASEFQKRYNDPGRDS